MLLYFSCCMRICINSISGGTVFSDVKISSVTRAEESGHHADEKFAVEFLPALVVQTADESTLPINDRPSSAS